MSIHFTCGRNCPALSFSTLLPFCISIPPRSLPSVFGFGEAIMSGCSKQCGFGSRALFRRVSHFPALSVSTLEQKIVISMSEVRQRTHRVARLFDAFSSFSLFLFQKCRTHLPGISRVQRAVATSLVIVQFSGHLVHLQSLSNIVECCLQTGKGSTQLRSGISSRPPDRQSRPSSPKSVHPSLPPSLPSELVAVHPAARHHPRRQATRLT